MFDLKVLKATLDQLEEEKNIPKERILEAIELALAAAYKKDYGKRQQIIRSTFNLETGDVEFFQVKIVVDETVVVFDEGEADDEPTEPQSAKSLTNATETTLDKSTKDSTNDDERIRFNPEHHIMIEDAQRIKTNAQINEELIFPLEIKEDFGRIAAQTAKQVIIQRIREAEKVSILDEYSDQQGEIVSGIIQKIERGNVYVDFKRAVGILPKSEQIPGEFYQQGRRIKAYLYLVEETPRGVNLRLSRTHPRMIERFFAVEAPEIAAGTVEIKSIAREAGSRSKIAVVSYDENVDPIGACVGQKGIRVATVMGELGNEKIDIIPWSEDSAEFVAASLAPAKVLDIEIDENAHSAKIEVAEDQLSLAIGKGGQNVRLAAKLTGWRIDIRGVGGTSVAQADKEGEVEIKDDTTESQEHTDNEISGDENTEA